MESSNLQLIGAGKRLDKWEAGSLLLRQALGSWRLTCLTSHHQIGSSHGVIGYRSKRRQNVTLWRSGGGYFIHSMKKLLLLFTELPAFGTKTNQAKLLLPSSPRRHGKGLKATRKGGGEEGQGPPPSPVWPDQRWFHVTTGAPVRGLTLLLGDTGIYSLFSSRLGLLPLPLFFSSSISCRCSVPCWCVRPQVLLQVPQQPVIERS